MILYDDQAKRTAERGKFLAAYIRRRMRQTHNAVTLRGVIVYQLSYTYAHIRQHKLGRAEHERTHVLKRDRRHLARGRERQYRKSAELQIISELCGESDRRLIIVFGRRQHRAYYIADGKPARFGALDRNDFLYRHRAVRYRARFIQTKRIYARQHFYTIQILHRRVTFGKPYDRCGKRNAREQEHTRRDHADQRAGYGSYDLIKQMSVAVPSRPRIDQHRFVHDERAVSTVYHKYGDRDHNDRYDFYNEIDRVVEFALRFLVFFRIRRKRFDIIVVAYLIHAGITVSRRHERSGKDNVAHTFADGNALSGKHGLVYFAFAFYYDRIRADLFARFEIDYVVEHHIAHRDRFRKTVAYDDRRRRGNEFQSIYSHFGFYFEDYTDNGVDRHYDNEQKFAPVLCEIHDQKHRDENHDDKKIEIREQVGCDYAEIRPPDRFTRYVDESVAYAFFHLLGSKPRFGVGTVPLGARRVYAVALLRFALAPL